MAEQVSQLVMTTERPLATIVDQLSQQLDASLVAVVGDQVAGSEVFLAVFERYYTRMKGIVSVSLLLTKQSNQVKASLVTSGGGTSVLNLFADAKVDLAQQVLALLKADGFEVA